MNERKQIKLFDGDLPSWINSEAQLREMRDFDFRFLLGLMEYFKPQKIVEVGVAAGVTTSVILDYLAENNPGGELYSIDRSCSFYRDKSKSSGYFAEEIKKNLKINVNHRLLLGNASAAFVDTVGTEIDFLILDTTHFLPGEILDFLTFLPYLKNDAIVVLHDVALSHVQLVDPMAISNKLLFDMVTAEKYYMEDPGYGHGLSNISAFRVADETREDVYRVASCLEMGWSYIPCESDLMNYRKVFEKNYGAQITELFDNTIYWQRKSVSERLIKENYRGDIAELVKNWRDTDNVYIYGCGYWGNIYYSYAKFHGLQIKGMIVSDEVMITDETKSDFDVPVYHLNELGNHNGKVIFALDDQKYEECKIRIDAYPNLTELFK